MSGYPSVSIIVPVYNSKDTIRMCLKSLLNLDYPFDRLEILAVDNNSTDGSKEIIAQFPVTYLLENKVQTSYGARNKGIENASGEILIFTDADCIADPQWLRNLLEGFKERNVGCCAGEILPYKPFSLVEVYSARKGFISQRITLSKPFLPFPQTANVAYRREVFERIGAFNHRLISGGDADFAWRMQLQTNLKIEYCPEAIVYHKHRSSLKGLFRQGEKYAIGKQHLHSLYPEYPVRSLLRELQVDFNSTVKNTLRFPFRLCMFLLRRMDKVELLRPWLDLLMMWARFYGMMKSRADLKPPLTKSVDANDRRITKVLFLDNAAKVISGAEFSLIYLIRNLDREKFLPIVACWRQSPLGERLSEMKVDVFDIRFPNLQRNSSRILGVRLISPFVILKNGFDLFKCVWKLAALMKKEKIEIAHVNTMLCRLPGLLAAKLSGTKIIWHIRDFVIQSTWLKLYDLLSRFVDQIITVSDACQVQFSRKDRIVTIYNGSDLNKYKFDSRLRYKFRNELGLDDGDIAVGNIGLLVRWKGIEVLLDAAKIALRRNERLKFLIVGDDFSAKEDNYKDVLVGKAKDLKIEKHVIFTGFRDNVTEAMSGIDIGVISSIRPDPFPRSVVEMMAVGVPLIASKIGGIPEAIEDNFSGFLVDPNNPNALAETIIMLSENDGLRQTVGRQAAQISKDRFDIQTNVSKTEEIYHLLDRQVQ